MFLLFALTGLDCGRYERRAYGTRQAWVGRGPVRQQLGKRKAPNGNSARPGPGCLRVRPRKDRDGFDLISDRLRRGPIWYAGPDAVRKAVAYAKYHSHSWSHRAIIRVFDEFGTAIEMHEFAGDFASGRRIRKITKVRSGSGEVVQRDGEPLRIWMPAAAPLPMPDLNGYHRCEARCHACLKNWTALRSQFRRGR